ncbi:hypothetical protein CASFOL_021536 [Castilleja foliolosa]|uniref:Uncharacterized protein n=1 Tax=Castilleja foliolosa TaxID=1961234 RepID=A0ABD3CXQ5_9LAMI
MGNQNTSGIAEEEKAVNKAPEKPQVSDQEEANEITDYQEKAAEADSQESEEADHREKPVENEEHKGSAANLQIDHVEPKESNFDENIMSELNNETHDQPCTLKEEKQMSESNSKPKSTTAIDIVSESQEDQYTLANEIVNEIVETLLVGSNENISTISLQNLCVAENEEQNECSYLAEEKQTTNELGNLDKTSFVEQTQPIDQETNQFATLDQSDHSNPMAENDQEDDNSSSCETIHETSHDIEKYIVTTEIEQGAEIEQNSNDENAIILENIENLIIEPISTYKGGEVELKKSPSFDFGLPFNARPGESDQTPLLYNGTATRSFSSMRYQNRSVQTEQYEAVEIEEKTIRMERSNSESSLRANLSLNLQNRIKNDNIVAKAKQADNGSPSREDCDVVSPPKESGKQKPSSPLILKS